MKFNELYKLVTEEEFFSEDIQKFKKIYNAYDLLYEHPLFTGNYGGGFNNQALNRIRSNTVKDKDKYIKDIIYAENIFKLYRGLRGDLIEDSLVWNDDLLAMYAYYRLLNDSGIEIDSSWNHQEMEGLFRFYFWNELFPYYSYIQSSDNNTKQSMDFWIKICKEANENNLTFSVINLNNKKEQIYKDYKKLENDKKQIWGNGLGNVRLRVYNKKSN